MGSIRSSSLCIGDDSSTVASSGRVMDAPGRSAARPRSNLETLLGRLLFPWIRVKEK